MKFKYHGKDFESVISTANGLGEDYHESSDILSRKNPWFGWFAIKSKGKIEEYFVGIKKEQDPSILLLSHPLAKEVYYNNDICVGKTYDIELPKRYRTFEDCEIIGKGTVLVGEKRLEHLKLHTKDGFTELHAIEGKFQETSLESKESIILPEETHLPDIAGLLTKEQVNLIVTRSSQPVIIQGRAGSGKTTVALYRIATLVHPPEGSNEAPVKPHQILYVMFNQALLKFIKGALENLDLAKVSQYVFHKWALAEIRKAYKRAPLHLYTKTSQMPGFEEASRLKKKVEILHVIEAYVNKQKNGVTTFLKKYLPPNDTDSHWLNRFKSEMATKTPIAHCLAILRTEARKAKKGETSREAARLHEIHKTFQHAFEKVTTYKKDLRSFLTNTRLLRVHLQGEELSNIKALVRYQKELQGSDRSPNSRISSDDLALLLYLIQLKHGGLTDRNKGDSLHFYEHLVIDEAQDFGAIELKVLFNSIHARNGVTIVGDTNQSIMSGKHFAGWKAVAKELDIGEVKVSRLEVSHRSTREIMRIADLLVKDETIGSQSGSVPIWFEVADDEKLTEQVADLIRTRQKKQPNAHVCVICPTNSKSTKMLPKLQMCLEDLEDVFPTRRGSGENFTFAAGTTVTLNKQVKGLEFDTVIIIDPIGDNWYYPPNEYGRNLLYTAITRAQRQLFFVSTQSLTPLLDIALQKGWIVDKADSPNAVPIVFDGVDGDFDEPF